MLPTRSPPLRRRAFAAIGYHLSKGGANPVVVNGRAPLDTPSAPAFGKPEPNEVPHKSPNIGFWRTAKNPVSHCPTPCPEQDLNLQPSD